MPFPNDVKPVWEAIWNEAAGVFGRWQAYKQLFDSGQPRIDQLNKIAPQFFFMFRAAILDDVILTVTRLGDPARTRHQRNATLDSLVDFAKTIDPGGLAVLLDGKLVEYRNLSNSLRSRRNKLLAHSDEVYLILEHAYGKGESARPPLANITVAEIEAILSSLGFFLNAFEMYFTAETTNYRRVTHQGGVGTLIYQLKKAIRYEELVNCGALDREDLSEKDGYKW
jgi:hypothetical protein